MFTAREVFENTLIELNKRKAPSLLLKDFNYFFNKASNNYANFKHNFYDRNQQSDDDLRGLKIVNYPITLSYQNGEFKGLLPSDYYHILNVSADFTVIKDFDCYKADDTFSQTCIKQNSNNARQIKSNYYYKPSYKNPYHYSNDEYIIIRSGATDKAVPNRAVIDYLKVPQVINLTQSQIEDVADNSQILDYSNYVVIEIINELVKLVLENSSDPRLQTNVPINKTIADIPQQR